MVLTKAMCDEQIGKSRLSRRTGHTMAVEIAATNISRVKRTYADGLKESQRQV